MHTIITALSFDSSDKAKIKLRVIELFDSSGLEATQLAFPGVSRASSFKMEEKLY